MGEDGVERRHWDQLEPFGDNPPDEAPDNNGALGHMPLRFPGQYFDKETNLGYNYFRDYDSAIGRYIQSDPIGLRGGWASPEFTDTRLRLPGSFQTDPD